MTLEEANKKLDEIVDECRDAVYCRAKKNSYGKNVVIHIEGEFSQEHLSRIARISECIE